MSDTTDIGGEITHDRVNGFSQLHCPVCECRGIHITPVLDDPGVKMKARVSCESCHGDMSQSRLFLEVVEHKGRVRIQWSFEG